MRATVAAAAAGAALIMFANASLAQSNEQTYKAFWSGEQLTEFCRSYLTFAKSQGKTTADVGMNASLCHGFVTAAIDVVRFEFAAGNLISELGFCLPPKLTNTTLTEVVAVYVDQHPERRSTSGYVLVREALSKAYPCRKSR